jgi:hypothetical protein
LCRIAAQLSAGGVGSWVAFTGSTLRTTIFMAGLPPGCTDWAI